MPIDRRPIEQMILDVGEEAFQRLAHLFESETRAALQDMRRLLATDDWRELGRQAHSLKHATSSFGLNAMALTASELERAADAADGREAAARLAQLETRAGPDLEELEQALRGLASAG